MEVVASRRVSADPWPLCSRSRTTNKYRAWGTAFFLAYPAGEWGETYLVTARHLLPNACSGDGTVHLRVNTRDGGVAFLAVPGGEGAWWTPDDEGVDVAVLPFAFDSTVDIRVTAAELIATDDVIAHYEIGVGDPLDIVGLFEHVQGRARNRPIVRTGTIAAMPDEPFIEKEGAPPSWLYLAEIRSHGGLSGSPVGVLLGYDRDADGNRVRSGPGFLLGMIRGHWELPDAAYNAFFRDADGTLNTGIALVTPMQEVTKLLTSDKARAKRSELSVERRGARVAHDSAEAIGPRGSPNPNA